MGGELSVAVLLGQIPGGMIAVFIVMIVTMIWAGIHAKKKAAARVLALTELADSWDGHFSADRNSRVENRFPFFPCLRRGDSRYAYNIIRAERDGCDIHAFDYHYTTTSTDSKGNRRTTHHHFSAVILEVPYALKSLNIRKEGFFDRLGDMFGGGDIDFESAEFSKRFHVKAEDRKWAYDVISTKTMELLLDGPPYSITLGGNTIGTWTHRHFDPPDFRAAVDRLLTFVHNIPADIRDAIQITPRSSGEATEA